MLWAGDLHPTLHAELHIPFHEVKAGVSLLLPHNLNAHYVTPPVLPQQAAAEQDVPGRIVYTWHLLARDVIRGPLPDQHHCEGALENVPVRHGRASHGPLVQSTQTKITPSRGSHRCCLPPSNSMCAGQWLWPG